jgi:hypothetical protein
MDGERTPLVSQHTIGYIHALMIDSVAALSTEPHKARALRNETMVEELELNNDAFRSELRDCLVDYYEYILKMDGAGGSSTLKRKFRSISANAATDGEGDAAAAAGEAGGGEKDAKIEPNPELASDTANSPTPPPAAAAASAAPAEAAPAAAAAEEAAEDAASPPGKGGRRRGKGAKTN